MLLCRITAMPRLNFKNKQELKNKDVTMSSINEQFLFKKHFFSIFHCLTFFAVNHLIRICSNCLMKNLMNVTLSISDAKTGLGMYLLTLVSPICVCCLFFFSSGTEA